MQEYKPPQTLNDIVNFIKGKKDIKSKKNNLAQNDIENIKKWLGGALSSSVDGLQDALVCLKEIPSEILSDVIVEKWDIFTDEKRKKFINKMVQELNRGEHEQKLKLHLSVKLAEIEPDISYRLLENVCRLINEQTKNDQIPKVGMLFQGIMLDGVPPALIKIRREEFKTLPRYEGIVLCILNMAFRDTSEKKLLDHRQQKSILKWVVSVKPLPEMRPQLIKIIVENIKAWPLSSMDEIRLLVNDLPDSFKKELFALIPALRQQPVAETSSTAVQEAPVPAVNNTKVMQEGVSVAFSPEDALKKLGEYISNLRGESRKCQEVNSSFKQELDVKTRKLENELRELRERNQKISDKNFSLEESNKRLREDIEKERANVDSLQADLNSTKKDCAALKTEKQKVEQEILSVNEKSEQEIQKLSERVESEAQARLNEFKNRLVSRLRIDYSDMMSAKDKPITPELGDNLRMQLKTIFDKLRHEGINCSENKGREDKA